MALAEHIATFCLIPYDKLYILLFNNLSIFIFLLDSFTLLIISLRLYPKFSGPNAISPLTSLAKNWLLGS